jgi:exo-beta-1,3-glucanase (GH17 family)
MKVKQKHTLILSKSFINLSLLTAIYIVLLFYGQNVSARNQVINISQEKPIQCAGFSPYVGKLNPNYGEHPSKALINELLDTLIHKTPFRCIMTYGVLNGLDNIFSAAEARNIKVIAIIWLDKDTTVNSISIIKGIEVAKKYPKTIIKLSCGSEVRTRNGYALDAEITRCINDLRNAAVTQPITTIDTWWEWCNRSITCQQTSFSSKVDWIGANVFPWWENKFSAIHTCVPAEKAADFQIARLSDIKKNNPNKNVILTEFGWPNAPNNGTEANLITGQKCGLAGKKAQKLIIESTFNKLAKKKWSGVAFESFSESWKPDSEGPFGSFWGICSGEIPYNCIKGLKIN